MSMMPGAQHPQISIEFFELAEQLKPYFSTIYRLQVTSENNARVCDYLHPEWTNLRFMQGDEIYAAIGNDTVCSAPNFIVTGPTSKPTFFDVGALQSWGIGMLPLGWAKFIPASAADYADRFADGAQDESFAAFAPLQEALQQAVDPSGHSQAALINTHLCALLDSAGQDNALVEHTHNALLDASISTVAELTERLDMPMRSLERLSNKAFGFPPKLLLRRQRFLRSLSRFMLDPSLKWINALDYHYHDQAHFTRDFQRFMGMGASKYAAMSKPIMAAAAHARMAAAGATMQVLHMTSDDEQ